MQNTTLKTDVAIVGGGPAGLMLAIELGCRGVACVLLEAGDGGVIPPKANATSARTMEHFRRRGFADEVRAVGLTAEHPQDVVYCTRLGGAELARFVIPSSAQAASRSAFGDLSEADWPTPELPHRGNQMFIEPILRREAQRHASVGLHLQTRAMSVHEQGEGVWVEALNEATGKPLSVQARYLVGCDGPRSIVRPAMGAVYHGLGGEQREFFGGQMLSIYFRSSDLYEQLGPKAWTWWLCNAEQRGVLVAINGVDEFIFGVQLRQGQAPEDVNVAQLFSVVCQNTFTSEVISQLVWTAGHMLVVDKMRAGRMFVAGDAAHLFTPTGGMGYNTSIDDAVNLGWKLAAVVRGWAPAALLDSYDAERRPIAQRNTAFARRMAESIGRLAISPALEQQDAEGEAARRRLGEQVLDHARSEFNIPGIQLGLRYGGAVIAPDHGQVPADVPSRLAPGAYSGMRAPHIALSDGRSIFDHFGRDFTLLVFAGLGQVDWRVAASVHCVLLDICLWPDASTREAGRALYGADLVLIRPDHHIAWRGAADADAVAVLARATGRP